MPRWSHIPRPSSRSSLVVLMAITVLFSAGAGLLMARQGIAKARPDGQGPRSLDAPRQDPSRTPIPSDQATPTPTPTNWIREMVVHGVAIDASQAMTTPVQGARIFVHMPSARCDPSTRTDASGRFSRSCHDIHFFESWFEIHVVADGYEAWTQTRGVVDFELEILARLEPHETGGATPTPTPVDLLRYVVLQGQVRRSHDQLPIEQARIEASPSPGRCLSPVFSDTDGQYELVCPMLNYIGTLDIRASKRGYRDWTRQLRGSEAGIGRMDIEMDFISMPPTSTPPGPTASLTPTPVSATETPGLEDLWLPILDR